MEFERVADEKRLQFIISVLKNSVNPSSVILDVGCGNGVISRTLGAEGFNVYGIDVSEKSIEKARKLNAYPNVKFDVISAEKLVAEGNRYDAVICSEVLEHLNDPGSLLKVLYRSLKETGKLIVTVPNGNGPRELFVTKPTIALRKKNGWMWKSIQKIKTSLGYKGTTVQSDADDLTHLQFFTRPKLEKLASEAQFTITKFGKTNFIEDVFPFSLLTKKIKFLQVMDCRLAEILPYSFTGGFVTVWEKHKS